MWFAKGEDGTLGFWLIDLTGAPPMRHSEVRVPVDFAFLRESYQSTRHQREVIGKGKVCVVFYIAFEELEPYRIDDLRRTLHSHVLEVDPRLF